MISNTFTQNHNLSLSNYSGKLDEDGFPIPEELLIPADLVIGQYADADLFSQIASFIENNYYLDIPMPAFKWKDLPTILLNLSCAFAFKEGNGIQGAITTYENLVNKIPFSKNYIYPLVGKLGDPNLASAILEANIRQALKLHVDVNTGKNYVVFSVDGTNFYFSKGKDVTRSELARHVNSKVGKDKKSDHPVVSLLSISVDNYFVYWHAFPGGTNENKQATIVLNEIMPVIRKVVDEYSAELGTKIETIFTADAGVCCDNVKTIVEEYGCKIVGRAKITSYEDVLVKIRSLDGHSIDKSSSWVIEINTWRCPNKQYCNLDSVPREKRKKHKVVEQRLIYFSSDQYKDDMKVIAKMEEVLNSLIESNKKIPIKIQSLAAGISELEIKEANLKLDNEKLTKALNRAGFSAYDLGTTEYGECILEASEAYKFQTLQELNTRSLKSDICIRPFHSKTDDKVLGQIALGILAHNLLAIISTISKNNTLIEMKCELNNFKNTKRGKELHKKLSESGLRSKLIESLATFLDPRSKYYDDSIDESELDFDNILNHVESLIDDCFTDSLDDNKPEDEQSDEDLITDVTAKRKELRRNSPPLNLSATELNFLLKLLSLEGKVSNALSMQTLKRLLSGTYIVKNEKGWVVSCKRTSICLWYKFKWLFAALKNLPS